MVRIRNSGVYASMYCSKFCVNNKTDRCFFVKIILSGKRACTIFNLFVCLFVKNHVGLLRVIVINI